MTRAAAKLEELAHVNEMIRLLGLEVEASPGSDDERPDFRFTLKGGRKIGLEHTRAVDRDLQVGRGVPARLTTVNQQTCYGREKSGPLRQTLTTATSILNFHGATPHCLSRDT